MTRKSQFARWCCASILVVGCLSISGCGEPGPATSEPASDATAPAASSEIETPDSQLTESVLAGENASGAEYGAADLEPTASPFETEEFGIVTEAFREVDRDLAEKQDAAQVEQPRSMMREEAGLGAGGKGGPLTPLHLPAAPEIQTVPEEELKRAAGRSSISAPARGGVQENMAGLDGYSRDADAPIQSTRRQFAPHPTQRSRISLDSLSWGFDPQQKNQPSPQSGKEIHEWSNESLAKNESGDDVTELAESEPVALADPGKLAAAGEESPATGTARIPEDLTAMIDGLEVLTQTKFGRARQLEIQAGEELWIIAQPVAAQTADKSSETPGCGALMATLPGQTEQVPVPLEHTAVDAKIDGYIATVNVRQEFHNPFDSKIEAVYVFPLPQNAAVNEFVMTVGKRRIRGIIREREQAEKIYAAARSQGHVASLMTQERPNIFTQKVANIEPGKSIDIDIRYFNTLQYDDGAYEFVFPMVVGPRFNPAASGGEGVGAIARGTDGSSGQKTEVAYLAPRERSGHDISMNLNIAAGVSIEDVHSLNHLVQVKSTGESQRVITLDAADSIPNKDFVLRYRVAGNQIKTALMTHEDKHGRYFTMMLYPPADLAQVPRSPMEMVFVLDCSGSMSGQPIAQAKAAISHALQSLRPEDTFQIIRFSNNASQLGSEPVLATQENIERGLKYLTSLNGSGGTHMIEGIRAALDFPHDEGRFRLVSFMTDGYIGNEQQILGTLHEKLGASRVFSFGVGSSPNRYLMNRMAVLGRGAASYLSLNDNATEIMDRFQQRISHPAMTDLSIDWGSMQVADVYPQRMPDLIVGRPVVLTGRFRGEPGTVSVNGRVDMEPASFQVELNHDDASQKHEGIAAVWARLKIQDMMNVATYSPEATSEIQAAVTSTALAYNLMSSYTAFVAVDSMTKTNGEFGTTVTVPVPVPEGVKYETTVGSK